MFHRNSQSRCSLFTRNLYYINPYKSYFGIHRMFTGTMFGKSQWHSKHFVGLNSFFFHLRQLR